MAENRSINIFVTLIDQVSEEARKVQNKLNGLENRRKAAEKAYKDGDRKLAKELNDSYKKDREKQLAELKKLNKKKFDLLQKIGNEEAKERARSVRDEQKASDSKLKIAEREAAAKEKIKEEEAKAEVERAKASIKTAKGEADERAEIAKAARIRVEEEERRATKTKEQEETRRTNAAREEAKTIAFINREMAITAETIDRENAKNEARAENRRRIREEKELLRITKQQQLEYERTATFMGRLRYQKQLLGDESNRLTVRLSRVGLAVRGVVVANALVFARALISVFVALAGQAVALAGSLVYAAGVLGGAFVAAAAQAIPVLGILAGAMSRLSIIQEAVNQNDLMQKQQFGDTGAADAASDSARQVADAQEAVKEAQENLTKAREQARRELRDLILSEKEAELAFRRSGLAQKESRAALRERIRTGEGSFLEFQSDMLAVPEARLSRRRSRNELTDTRQDLSKALRGGIEGMEGVKSATKALADAQRSLADAQRSATSGMNSQSAAASNLQYFLSQLTPTERKVYKAFIGFRDRFDKVLSSITDILFKNVLGSFDKIEKALFNPRLISGFKNLASSLGDSFNSLINLVTSNKSINFWEKTLGRASGNMKPLTSLAKTLYRTFMNLADAAAPAFKEILGLINGEFKKFEKTTGKKSAVREFFSQGITQLKAWGRLVGSIIDLFGALFGASSKSALNTLDDLTARIDRATEWIRENPKQVEKFFMDTSRAFGYLVDIVEHLGAAMLRLFDADTIETFSIIIDDVLIPALVQAIEWFSLVVEVFEFFIRLPLVPQILAILGAMKVFTASFGLLLALLKSIAMPLWRFANVLLPNATGALKAFFAAENWSIAGIKSTLRKARLQIALFGQYVKSTRFGQFFVEAWSSYVTPFFNTVFPRRFRGFFGKLRGPAKAAGKGLGILFVVAMVAGIFEYLDTGSLWRKFMEFGIKAAVAIGKGFAPIWNATAGKILGEIDTSSLEERGRRAILNDQIKPLEEEIANIRASGEAKSNKAVKERLNDLIKQRREIIRSYYEEADIRNAIERGQEIRERGRGQERRGERNKAKGGALGPEGPLGPVGPIGPQRGISQNTDALKQNTDAKKNNRRETRLLNKEQDEAAAAARRAARRQAEQREEVKRAKFQQSKFANQLKKTSGEQKDFDNKTKKATQRSEEQRKGARKLARGLRRLDDTVRGVGNNSRGLGKMFGDVTNKVLDKFGVKKLSFTLPSAGSVFKDITSSIGGMFASGGYFGDKSLRNHDDRLIAVAGGEAILTGYHQPEVNTALSFANAHGVTRHNSLDSMFSNERRPHYTAPAYNTGGKVPGFARGGYAGLTGDLDFSPALGMALSRMAIKSGVPIYVQDGGRTMAEQAILYQRWLNGTGNLAAAPNANAPHIRGIAADITPGSEVFGNIAGRFGLGFTVPGESWHIELLSGEGFAGGMMAGMMAPLFKKIKIAGPEGPFKNMLGGQEEEIRKAANEYLKANLPVNEGGMTPPYGPVTSTIVPGRKIRTGYTVYDDPPPGSFGALDRGYAELGTATTSGLTGGGYLAQAFGMPGELPENFPLNVSINGRSKKLYKRDRGWGQGSNSHGIDIWLDSWDDFGLNSMSSGEAILTAANYARGGRIPEFDNGGIVPGRMGQPMLAKVHGGETIIPTHKMFNQGGTSGGGKTKKGKNKDWEPKAAAMFKKGPLKGLEDLSAAFKGLTVALKDRFKKGSDTFKKETKNLDDRLEKFFDGIAEANRKLESMISKQSRKLNRWAFKVVRGYAAQVRTTEQITKRELSNLKNQEKYLNNQERILSESVKDLQKQLKQTDKDQKNLRKKIRFAISKARKEQQAVVDKLNENIIAQVEAQRAILDEELGKIDAKRGILDLRIRIQEALGQLEMNEDSQVNPNKNAIIDLINQDTAKINSAITAINKELRKAERAGATEEVDKLRTQLLENQLAIIENNLRIKELNEATQDNTDATQENTGLNFTTTAWEEFRVAVLSGVGINPKLAQSIPKLNTGGYIAREGLAYLHSAEVVTPANGRMMQGANSGPLVENINFTQPMEVADPVAISNQIGFKLSTLKSV